MVAVLPPGPGLSFRPGDHRLPSVRPQAVLLPGTLVEVVLHQLPQQLAPQ